MIKIRNKAVIACCATMVTCACIGIAIPTQKVVANTGHASVCDLFLPADVQINPMYVDPDALYLERGLCITSNNEKEFIELRDSVCGEFTFDYLPLKTENGKYSAQRLEVLFTDEHSSDEWTLVIEHGETTNAYVEFNGVTAGIYYYKLGTQGGLTQLGNSTGDYTQFSADKIRVRFDPHTMSVYVGSAESEQSLVWSMSEKVNDGRNVGEVLSPFKSYNVSFGITEYLDENGSVLLYSVNDTALNGLFLNDSTPVLFADVEYDAVVGVKYTLPEAYAYDVADGMISSADIRNRIYYEGTLIQSNSKTFTPNVAGDYVIEYETENNAGIVSQKSYAFTVHEKMPVYETELEWDLQDEYVVGSRVVVPNSVIYGGLRRYGTERGTLTIFKNGIALRAYSDVYGGFAYTFSAVGEYVFQYDLGGETGDYTVNVTDGNNAFITDSLDKYYLLNSFVDCSSFVFKMNGQETDYDFMVIYPSGKRLANDKFIVDEVGRYIIMAEKTLDGRTVAFERSFDVYTAGIQSFASTSNSVTVEYGKSIFTAREGVVVTTTQSGTLVEYTQPIDLSTYVGQTQLKNDKVTLSDRAKPLIEFSVDPSAYGIESANGINLYITDAANPENKITIVVKSENSKKWSYIRAAATGQELSGWDNDSDKRWMTNYGFITLHSFKGMLVETEKTADTKIALYYDSENKQLLSLARYDYQNHIINDFDDPKYTGGAIWDGFTSNQVYLSFEVTGVSAISSSVVVYKLNGTTLTDKVVLNRELPTIEIDGDDSLTGVKGYSLAVPTARAFDYTGKEIAQITNKVYYENGGRLYDVSINNGRFATPRVGTYYIVYQAIDCFGNVATERLTVDVDESVVDWRAVWIDGEVPEEYKSGVVGQALALFGKENIYVENAFGDVAITRKVYRINGSDLEEIAVEEDMLLVEKQGVYRIDYEIIDEIGRKIPLSYETEMEYSSDVVIVSDIPYYIGFVRGNEYKIHDLYYKIYNSENVTAQKADVYINGEKYTKDTYALEKVVETENASEAVETVSLRYQSGDIVLREYEIPVKTVYKEKTLPGRPIKTTRFLPERYFVCDEGDSVVAKTNYLLLSTISDDHSIRFAQAISVADIEFLFDVDFERSSNLEAIATNVQALNVYLTDSTNIHRQLKLTMFMENGTLKFAINDDYMNAVAMSGSLTGTSFDGISFKFGTGTNTFYDGTTSTKLGTPIAYLNGDAFVGFGGEVYVSFAMDRNAEGTTNIRLYSIGNQSFSNNESTDSGEPTIIVSNELSGVYTTGTRLTVPAATVSDVLSSIYDDDFTVTVTMTKDGVTTIVKDVLGNELNNVSAWISYEIILSDMGDYRIVYTAKDSRGTQGTREYVVTAINRVEPTITLSGDVPKQISYGATVSLPTATVGFMEINDANLSYAIYIAPSGRYYMVENGKFVATEKGVYVIRYYALDTYGNYTLLEYSVTCR